MQESMSVHTQQREGQEAELTLLSGTPVIANPVPRQCQPIHNDSATTHFYWSHLITVTLGIKFPQILRDTFKL